MAKPVVHSVDNLEAGQRDSIRRARAKAAGATAEELANLPSDREINAAAGARRAEAQEDSEPSSDEGDGTPDPTPEPSARRGPTPSSTPHEEES